MQKIILTRGAICLVDDDDFAYLSQFKWHMTAGGYAARNASSDDGNRTILLMHRAIMRPKSRRDHVDHASGDKLDNRRSNLRICGNSENKMNQGARANKVHSKYVGVTFDVNRKKWSAQIQAYGLHMNLGRFESEVMAANAYNEAAVKHHGEYARLNAINPKP